eukprot:CAMPEP_0170504532 /NCGR_PEP_ID=MMETSP0208-20121228/48205_1 /TAXON_ID=197538 /ORGANISM="Strombidium inclinatum, Strain S3" /LENGTH=99 /DNA_ID=CAMNT_0010784849 /DNA_START=789 /DNA_END=1085 /DNA_ORIENTATION=+
MDSGVRQEKYRIPPTFRQPPQISDTPVMPSENTEYLSPPRRQTVASRTKTSRILVVDDQLFNIDAIKIILRWKLQINPDLIDSAFNGGEAVDLIEEDLL